MPIILTVTANVLKFVPEHYFNEFYSAIYRMWQTDALFVNAVGIVSIGLFGFFLNSYKMANQIAYGYLEVLCSLAGSFAVINKYLSLRTSSNESFDMLGIMVPLITAMYFTQRGVGNISEGYKKKKLVQSQG